MVAKDSEKNTLCIRKSFKRYGEMQDVNRNPERNKK